MDNLRFSIRAEIITGAENGPGRDFFASCLQRWEMNVRSTKSSGKDEVQSQHSGQQGGALK